MKLLSLELSNFRVFYGLHNIEFSHSDDKPLTVMTGFNGGGKTSLLNALYWCFTGTTTPQLNDPDLLVNKDAANDEKNAIAYSEVTFQERNDIYRIRRTVNASNTKQSFSIFQIGNDGTSKEITNPEIFVQKFIPKKMAEWFFYDAEAIGNLNLSGNDSFKKSLRKTFGFEIVDSLIEDLDSCLTKRKKEFSRSVKSESLEKVLSDIDYFKKSLQTDMAQKEEASIKLDEASKRFTEKDNALRKQPSMVQLHRARDDEKSRLDRNTEALNKAIKERKTYLGIAFPALLIHAKASEFSKHLQIEENKGRLPSAFKDQLLDEIMEERECICGTKIIKDSTEEAKILDLYKIASTSVFNDKIRNIQYLLKEIERNAQEYEEKIKDMRITEISISQQISGNEAKLKEIKAQIDEIPLEIVAQLEKERENALSERNKFNNIVESKKTLIQSHNHNIFQLEARYKVESERIKSGEKVQQEIDKISKIMNYTRELLRIQEKRALTVLSVELNRLLKKFLIKDFRAQIDSSDYRVTMFDDEGKQVSPGTGEDAVLKYAFIATVVSLTGKKTIDKIDFMADPINAPLILDAPFTSMSDSYKELVATNLVLQASQLILFVLPEVLSLESLKSSLHKFTGKEYILHIKARGDRGEKRMETTSINGKSYPLNSYNNTRNETEVIEVNK